MGEKKRTMKALVKVGEERGFSLQEIPVPEPGDSEVLVRVKAAAICGSDLKLHRWTPWCREVGDAVAAETHIPCGRCWQCTHNRPHTCTGMELFGHTVNGCFAEYFVIPEAAAWKLSGSYPLEQGCLLEPMGIPLRAVYGGEVAGDSVAVLGCGPIGQFAVGIARIRGADQIIAIDVNDRRLAIARRMGATATVNPGKQSPVSRVLSLTAGEGAGTVIDASGNDHALAEAFDYVRIGGTIFAIGHPPRPLSIDVSPKIILREVKLAGLFGRELWRTWEIADSLLASGSLDTAPIVTHRFSLDEQEKAFDAAESGEGCKVVFTF
jgi:threonine 3-dehydrogenase